MADIVSARTVRDWGERYSNWGRWGDADQLGTLNFITRAHVRAACGLPRSGRTISCAMTGAESEAFPRGIPLETSWNAPSNVCFDGLAFNGREPERRIDGNGDASEGPPPTCPVVGRGVLLDLPRLARRPWLEGGTRIGPTDLDLCAESFGVTIDRGDIVLIRTGALRRCREAGSWRGFRTGPTPGLSVHCAHWIFEREIAALAIDTFDSEVHPCETECDAPLHRIAVRNSGLLLGAMFDFDELSDACAADGNYAFLFVASPLPIAGAGRAGAIPVAIK